MIHALGVTGYEGVFRRTCEVTLRLARKENESLVNVLETLVHDPLLEWSTRSRRSSASKGHSKEGETQINTVRNKLLGLGTHRRGIALSIEGQVRTNDTNDSCHFRRFGLTHACMRQTGVWQRGKVLEIERRIWS